MYVLFKLMGWVVGAILLLSCEHQSPSAEPSVLAVKEDVLSEKESTKKGKRIFLKNCASCHNINMTSDMTGPALYDVEKRWEKRSDLIQFIQNPQKLINENHPYAVELAALWPSEMTAFPDLDSLDIIEVLKFVQDR